MSGFQPFSRRTFLRGAGTAMSLPLLEGMAPVIAEAAGSNGAAVPPRMAFIFFPNGAIQPDWKSSGEGENFELGKSLEPIKKFQKKLNVFSGLTQHHGRANGDGGGDHARNASSFLTGAQPRKTSGSNIHVGVSVDQAAASLIGSKTRLPSLELGIDRGRNAGNCDSGYSCAYSSNISWKTASTPMAKEINPRLAFERLFGDGEESKKQQKRDLYRKSILDLVSEDATTLKKKLGQTDRQKVDEYFTSVRELELRIARSTQEAIEIPDYEVPAGVPGDLETHVRLMYDILLLAFQTDSTRIATFMVGNAGSNRSYPMVGVNDGHHGISHHRDDEKKVRDIAKIDKYLVSQFAYFLEKLETTREGESNLLENSMILYGSAIADGNRHSHHDLPIVLAGSGGGRLKTGRHMVYPNETPLNNLFVTMCQQAGAGIQELGDSTGVLSDLLT